MAKRKRRHNQKRSAVSDINMILETALCSWHHGCIPDHWNPVKAAVDFRRAWSVHQKLLLPFYIKALPGCRPFAEYALRNIPEPRLCQKPFGDKVFDLWDYNFYFENASDETDYLASLGIVDGEELRLARARQKTENHTRYTPYSPVKPI